MPTVATIAPELFIDKQAPVPFELFAPAVPLNWPQTAILPKESGLTHANIESRVPKFIAVSETRAPEEDE